MAHREATVTLPADADALFAHLGEVGNLPAYVPGVRAAARLDEE